MRAETNKPLRQEPTMNATTASKTARTTYSSYRADVRALEARIESAILSATGAVVEVTFNAGKRITVSATSRNACAAASKVMVLAGCTLTSSVWDEELGEQFDYYEHA